MDIKAFDHSTLASQLATFFQSKQIEELSRASKFIQRSTSRLSGMDFLSMNVFDSTSGKERSLNDCCLWLEDNCGVSVCKQSLDERFNTDAVRFMRACLSSVVEQINDSPVTRGFDFPFSVVHLTDSTSFKIPDVLSHFYEGSAAGNSGKAIIKIHLGYNFLDGKIRGIHFRNGKEHDGSFDANSMQGICANGLYLRDLGYYNMKHFSQIAEAQAYFLSRGKSSAVYNLEISGKHQRVDLSTLLPKEGECVEYENVKLGSNKNGPLCRLLIESVPPEVAAVRYKRLMRTKAGQKHRNWTVSELRKQLCHFNLYITNAPKDKLPTHLIRPAYRLRWQIELVFKIWKSIFKIDEVKKMSVFRFECYLYAKLIAIILSLHIHHRFNDFLWETHEFEASPIKVVKIVKNKLQTLIKAILGGKRTLVKWIKVVLYQVVRKARKVARKLKGEPPGQTAGQILYSLA